MVLTTILKKTMAYREKCRFLGHGILLYRPVCCPQNSGGGEPFVPKIGERNEPRKIDCF